MRLRLHALAALSILSLGCTTLYEATWRAPAYEVDTPSAPVEHCLISLGFENRSADDVNLEFIREDPNLRAVWYSTPERSFSSNPPSATASIWRETDRWNVRFVPSNGGGDDAKYFANAIRSCLRLHDREIDIEISSGSGIDLR